TVQTDNRLLEMNMGNFEGLTMEEIERENVNLHYHYWNNPALYKNDSGETFYEVRERIEDFIKHLLRVHDEGKILIVTHGIIVKIVQLIFEEYGIEHLWETSFISGTSVTKVEINSQNKEMHYAGDISHLE